MKLPHFLNPQTPGTDRANNNQDIMAHLDKLVMTWITAREACKLPSLACIGQVEEKPVRNMSRSIGFICMSYNAGFPEACKLDVRWAEAGR